MVLNAEDIMSTLPSILPEDLDVASATKLMAKDHRGFVLVGEDGSTKAGQFLL